MRLVVQAQGPLEQESIAAAFRRLPVADMETLAFELTLSGMSGELYAKLEARFDAGPAFIGYYSPAFLRKNAGSVDDAQLALSVLACVYRAARQLWAVSSDQKSSSVTLMLDQLKAASLEDILSTYADGECWLLVRSSAKEGTVERHPLASLQTLLTEQKAVLLPLWRGAVQLPAAASRASAMGTQVV